MLLAQKEKFDEDFPIDTFETAPSKNKKRRKTSDTLLLHHLNDENSDLVSFISTEGNRKKSQGIKGVVDADQKIILTRCYQETKYPNTQQKIELGERLGLETRQISSWFKNVRKIDKQNRTCPQRIRGVFDADQKLILMKSYQETKYPDKQKMKELGKQLGLEARQISSWLKNMRSRDKHSGTCHERPVKPRNSFYSQFKRTGKYQNNATVKDSESLENLKRKEIVIDKTFFSEQTLKLTSDYSIADSVIRLDSIIDGAQRENTFTEVLTGDDEPLDGLLDDFKLQADRLWKSNNSSCRQTRDQRLRPTIVEDIQSPISVNHVPSPTIIEEVQSPFVKEEFFENPHSDSNPVKLKSQTKPLLDSLKHIANPECLLYKVQLPGPKHQEKVITEKQLVPSSEVVILKAQIKAMERRQIVLESHNTLLISSNTNLEKINNKSSAEKAKSDHSKKSALESLIAKLSKQHQNDVKTMGDTENVINSLICKINSMHTEVSQAKLSHERSSLKLDKLKVNNSKVEHLKQMRTTLELILGSDSKFCKTDLVENLSDSDVVEYVNSILVELKDTKKHHFTHVQDCIFKLQKCQQRHS